MYNEEEFLKFYEKQKTCFEKEINETKNMLKEVIGEEKDGFYRISQMLRLIEFDYKDLLESVGELAEAVNYTKKQLEKLKSLEDEFKQTTKIAPKEYASEEFDVVSEIVKKVNRLDNSSQRLALSYIIGMVTAFEDSKTNKKPKKFM